MITICQSISIRCGRILILVVGLFRSISPNKHQNAVKSRMVATSMPMSVITPLNRI